MGSQTVIYFGSRKGGEIMGIISNFFGMSKEQADRDVDKGHAEPRNDAEDAAAFDYCNEALETGNDPIPSGNESSEK